MMASPKNKISSYANGNHFSQTVRGFTLYREALHAHRFVEARPQLAKQLQNLSAVGRDSRAFYQSGGKFRLFAI